MDDHLDHTHEAPLPASEERQSVISKRLRLGYVVTNGLASIGELTTGIISGDIALAVDGLHGSAEIVIGNTQMKDAHEQDHVKDTKRKAVYTTLSGLSLAAAGVAAGDLAGTWDVGIESLLVDTMGLSAATLSAGSGIAAASIIVSRLRRKYGSVMENNRLRKDIAPTEQDVVKHIVFLDTPTSLVAFASSAIRFASYYASSKNGLGNELENIESALGVVGGAWGAYLFRPTSNNLVHQHTEPTYETIPEGVEELLDVTYDQDDKYS